MEITEQENFIREVNSKVAQEIANEIDAQMLGEFEGKVLPDNLMDVDPEYLQNIKKKVEKLLLVIINHYKLNDYIDVKLRCRLSQEKLHSSKLYELYEQQKDINGNQLRYGYEYIPNDFDEWLMVYLRDYAVVESIYTLMCYSRRIVKKDLLMLNEIAQKYGVE